MSFDPPPLVPELDVLNLAASLAVYTGVFGFSLYARRPAEGFAYLIRETAHMMLQEAEGPGRRFRTAPLERPLGRGINFQIRVSDADTLYQTVLRSSLSVVIPLEMRWYRHGTVEYGNRQFVVADPDGYLLRFAQSLGERIEK